MSSELQHKYNVRSIPIRKDDEVQAMGNTKYLCPWYTQLSCITMSVATHMCIKVATLSKPLINNLTSVMEYTQTQSTSTSIAWQYKHNVVVTPKV